VEEALFNFCGERVETVVAGRTDSGVHALGQVAHVDIEKATSANEVMKAVNAHLMAHPISVVNAQAVDDDFHARFSAQMRHYTYRIINRPSKLTVERGLVWHVKHPLDMAAMQKAANYLVGPKCDMSAFRAADCQAKHPMRSIENITFEEFPDPFTSGRDIRMHISAISFLHHQVRNIIGTLEKVGAGKWPPEKVKEILDGCDRTKAGPTAPPDGLYFVKVDYTKSS
jgi:tRNA pseudouridine38-40 synthase